VISLQLGGIFDREDPLAVGDRRRERVEHRRLAGSGAAGDEDVEAGLDAALEQVGRVTRERPELHQRVHVEALIGELADRQQRAGE
jgi:hypothetical protein